MSLVCNDVACSYLSSLHPRTDQSKNAVDFEDLWNTDTQRKPQKFLAHDAKGYSTSLILPLVHLNEKYLVLTFFFLVAMRAQENSPRHTKRRFPGEAVPHVGKDTLDKLDYAFTKSIYRKGLEKNVNRESFISISGKICNKICNMKKMQVK